MATDPCIRESSDLRTLINARRARSKLGDSSSAIPAEVVPGRDCLKVDDELKVVEVGDSLDNCYTVLDQCVNVHNAKIGRRGEVMTVGYSSTIRERLSKNDPCSPLKVHKQRVQAECLKEGDFIDVNSYLFPSPADYLLRCLQGKKYVIMFSVSLPPQSSMESSLCHLLQDVVPDLIADGRHDFEVVLAVRPNPDINSDDTAHQEAFIKFFSGFPASFLAVPIHDTRRCLKLFYVMGWNLHRSFMVVDLKERRVSLTSPFLLKCYGADFYPFTYETREELDWETKVLRRGLTPLASLLRLSFDDILHCACVQHRCGSTSCGKKLSLFELSNKVVGVYILRTGDYIDKILDLCKLCKDKNLEFELILVCAKRGFLREDKSWEDFVDSVLWHPENCCGWLQLPFDDRVIRRLDLLCDSRDGGDTLTIVQPNGSCTDPHGLEVFCDYGIDAYPFTKEAVWVSQVARLRCLDLQGLLTSVGIHDLILEDRLTVPISTVQGRDVLLYFGEAPDNLCESYLFKWFHELKTSGEAGFEMIFVCPFPTTHEDTDGSFDCKCRVVSFQSECKMPWLSVPHNEDGNTALLELLFGAFSNSVVDYALVAFGSNGRLRSLFADETLMKQSQSGPVTFPESDNLHWEVGMMLSQQPLDYWCHSFGYAANKHVYCREGQCNSIVRNTSSLYPSKTWPFTPQCCAPRP